MHQLAIVHDHPYGFQLLFAALSRAGIDYLPVHTAGHGFDPIGGQPPAPVIFNRIAMSSARHGVHHPVYYAMALLDHWAGQGALVLNGADAMAIDASKARQLALINRLGLAAPATRVVHDTAALLAAATTIGFPVVVKADVSGAGSGVTRFDDRAALAHTAEAGLLPPSANGVWLCQALVKPRDGTTTRIEVLGGRYLYGVDVAAAEDALMLASPDDRLQRLAQRRRRRAEPPPNLIAAAEMLAREAGMEVCSIEYMIDDVCGTPRFHDINGLSPFVENPMDVLGWDPHDRLVERLWHHIRRMGG
ncbi:ATP-grasp domain-containing protein [Sandarakinorhabdus limnophila]|uniref:ATP-grasp domain-containing protein n=1 Tax=Sandarakinorhabdus limnophila TaxID=210512 RepID=UPI0026EBE0FC|nr:alpha-L-glutamate ligase [Sandarakinorhabdus limnophila]